MTICKFAPHCYIINFLPGISPTVNETDPLASWINFAMFCAVQYISNRA